MNAVYPNLIREIEQDKLSITTISKLLHVSKSTVYRRLQGATNWKLWEVGKICQYLDNSDATELFLRLDTN